MPLTQEEKARIREEEIVRELARHEADSAGHHGCLQILSRFFNSPFAIWFLSSVVLALVASAYSTWQEGVKDAARIKQLDGEIAFRRTYFVDDVQKHKPDLEEAVSEFDRTPEERVGTSEFVGKSTSSLLYELTTLVPGSEKDQVISAYNVLRQLRPLRSTSDPENYKCRVDELLNVLAQRPKWNVE
jgi:hypothetical protein